MVLFHPLTRYSRLIPVEDWSICEKRKSLNLTTTCDASVLRQWFYALNSWDQLTQKNQWCSLCCSHVHENLWHFFPMSMPSHPSRRLWWSANRRVTRECQSAASCHVPRCVLKKKKMTRIKFRTKKQTTQRYDNTLHDKQTLTLIDAGAVKFLCQLEGFWFVGFHWIRD